MVMLSNLKPFLDSIVECHADDTVRLVFADWLQENDMEVWANLIRNQIKWNKVGVPPPSTTRSSDILTVIKSMYKWNLIDADMMDVINRNSIWNRGFPVEVKINKWMTWLSGRDFLHSLPIQKVFIHDSVPLKRVLDFSSMMYLYTIPDTDVEYWMTPYEHDRFVHSPGNDMERFRIPRKILNSLYPRTKFVVSGEILIT